MYYRVDGGTVTFGSELRAVLAALPERPRLDTTALNLFLRYRYTPSPLTLYEGIHKLAPGTMAVFENGRLRGSSAGTRVRAARSGLATLRRGGHRGAVRDLQAGAQAAPDRRRAGGPAAFAAASIPACCSA